MPVSEIILGLISLFKLASLILTEIFEAKKRARLAQEKYELTAQRFIEISQVALDRMRTEAVKEAQQAQDVEDQVDKDLNP